MRRMTALWIAVGLAVAAVPALDASAGNDAVADRAEKAAQLMFASDASEARVMEGMLLLLDAVAELAPDSSALKGCASRLADARSRIRDTSPMDATAAKLLRECHREIHGGVSFEMPASVRSVPDAVEYGRRRLESVRSLLDQGKPEEAARGMLEAVLAVITPIEQRM